MYHLPLTKSPDPFDLSEKIGGVEKVSVTPTIAASALKPRYAPKSRPLSPNYVGGMALFGLLGGVMGAAIMYVVRSRLSPYTPYDEMVFYTGASNLLALTCLSGWLTAGELTLGTQTKEILPWVVISVLITTVAGPVFYLISDFQPPLPPIIDALFGFAYRGIMLGWPLLLAPNLTVVRFPVAIRQGVIGGCLAGVAMLGVMMMTDGIRDGTYTWHPALAFAAAALTYGLVAGIIGQIWFAQKPAPAERQSI